MVWLFLLTFFIFFASSASAQIPLFYQLAEAYRPLIETTISSPVPIPSPIPSFIPQKTLTIAILGDSMIDTLNPGLPQLQTALHQYFPKYSFQILNYGVGGQNIESGLSRLTTAYDYRGQHFDSLVSQKPDLVVVESFAYNNFGNSQSGIDRHWLDLGAITTTLKRQLPQVKIIIATTIAPNSIVFGNGIKDVHFSALEKIEKSATIKLYLENAANFANSQGFPLADAYHPSLFNNDGLQEFINADDNLHPSGPGGQFFCDTIADTIYKNKLIE